MYVGELLPVIVLHDEIGFAFFNGPGRRGAAGYQLLLGHGRGAGNVPRISRFASKNGN